VGLLGGYGGMAGLEFVDRRVLRGGVGHSCACRVTRIVRDLRQLVDFVIMGP
jgi:hypothetical protein